jgi:antitoxin (DNA-binding transcriptional repressor) of toxin-antitoxin stability system
VAKAKQGEETIIAIAGKPAARLVPLKKQEKIRRLGFLKDMGYKVPEDIKTHFKKDIEEMFYGNPDKLKRK